MNKKASLISVVDINDRRYKSGFIDISNTYYEITLERAGVYCQSLKKRLITGRFLEGDKVCWPLVKLV